MGCERNSEFIVNVELGERNPLETRGYAVTLSSLTAYPCLQGLHMHEHLIDLLTRRLPLHAGATLAFWAVSASRHPITPARRGYTGAKAGWDPHRPDYPCTQGLHALGQQLVQVKFRLPLHAGATLYLYYIDSKKIYPSIKSHRDYQSPVTTKAERQTINFLGDWKMLNHQLYCIYKQHIEINLELSSTWTNTS